jgi:hypothetical protein
MDGPNIKIRRHRRKGGGRRGRRSGGKAFHQVGGQILKSGPIGDHAKGDLPCNEENDAE